MNINIGFKAFLRKDELPGISFNEPGKLVINYCVSRGGCLDMDKVIALALETAEEEL